MATQKLLLDDGGLDAEKRSNNLNYLCHIYSSDLNKSIWMLLPEDFNFSIATQFAQPFAQGFAKSQFMQNLNTLGSITGMGVGVSQSATLQIWQGTSEVSFTLTFDLIAETDAENEVVKPIKDLLYLTMPSSNGLGLLTPPGPSLSGSFADWATLSASFKNKTALVIGNFLMFDSVVIESVNHVFDSHFDANGFPLSARVDVAFKTFVVPIREDIDKLFFNSRQTNAAVAGGDRGTRGGA